MRHCLFLFLFLLAQLSSAQLIDFNQPLFKVEGFFNSNEVKKNKIRFIKITKSNKKDGKAFQREVLLLNYNFSKKGVLVGTEKYIRLSHKTDTAKIQFFYDRNLRLYKRIERQGPFRFDFHFQYKDELIYKEIKVDGNSESNDTAYLRFFDHNQVENKLTTTISNAIHKAFQIREVEKDNKGRITKQEIRFTRNSNSYTTLYGYDQDRLLQKREISHLGKNSENTWTFSYKGNKVDGIQLGDGEQALKKYALLYENGLPSAIIERNSLQKEVVLYKFQYIFYD